LLAVPLELIAEQRPCSAGQKEDTIDDEISLVQEDGIALQSTWNQALALVSHQRTSCTAHAWELHNLTEVQGADRDSLIVAWQLLGRVANRGRLL